MLMPGHFLIGRLIESLPFSNRPYSFYVDGTCARTQFVIFGNAGDKNNGSVFEDMPSSTMFCKPMRNIVILHDGSLVPTKWSLGKVLKVFTGIDGFVCVVEVKTQSGTLTRPVYKLHCSCLMRTNLRTKHYNKHVQIKEK